MHAYLTFLHVSIAEKKARAVFEVFLAKSHKVAILEMANHPKDYTAIAALVEKHGWQMTIGTEAMIYQGLAQSSLWTGQDLRRSHE